MDTYSPGDEEAPQDPGVRAGGKYGFGTLHRYFSREILLTRNTFNEKYLSQENTFQGRYFS